jgi:hypothetical protein
MLSDVDIGHLPEKGRSWNMLEAMNEDGIV